MQMKETRKQGALDHTHGLTFVTVLYGKSSLGGFVVSHVAQTFTFPRELVLDDHAILDISIFLRERREANNQREYYDFFILLGCFFRVTVFSVSVLLQGDEKQKR